MAGVKKAITYKTGYKDLKNMISAKLAKEHQFFNKKERKEAVKGVIGKQVLSLRRVYPII